MAGLIFLLLAAASVSAQTNQDLACCRHRLRIFGNHATVDLEPLFRWWTQQELANRTATNQESIAEAGAPQERPLSAWQRIAGVKVSELEYSWVVDAAIYTSPTTRTNARIILENPPAAEEQNFYNLKGALAAATQQITNDQVTYQADIRAAKRADARAQAINRFRSGKDRLNAGVYLQWAARDQRAALAALDEQKRLEAACRPAEKEYNAIPAVDGRYKIDWFALAVGRSKQGVPIYDLGVVDPDSP